MTDSSPFLGNTGIVPGSPEPGGFFGPYRGVVTNTTDPAGQSRIKAVIPQLFGNTSTECDWALPCQLPGLLSVPSPGQGVWISFEGGDINYPVYMGMWQAEPSVAPYDPAGTAVSAAGAAGAAAVATAVATAEAYTTAQLLAYVPLLNNPVGRANGSSGGTSGSLVVLNFSTFQHGGMTYHSAGAGGLVVPVSGWYQVSGQWECVMVGAGYGFASIYLNGAKYSDGSEGYAATATSIFSVVTDIVPCNANDLLQLGFATSVGGTFSFSNLAASLVSI